MKYPGVKTYAKKGKSCLLLGNIMTGTRLVLRADCRGLGLDVGAGALPEAGARA